MKRTARPRKKYPRGNVSKRGMSSDFFTPNKVKAILIPVGIILLTFIPVIGFFVLLFVVIHHFKTK